MEGLKVLEDIIFGRHVEAQCRHERQVPWGAILLEGSKDSTVSNYKAKCNLL